MYDIGGDHIYFSQQRLSISGIHNKASHLWEACGIWVRCPFPNGTRGRWYWCLMHPNSFLFSKTSESWRIYINIYIYIYIVCIKRKGLLGLSFLKTSKRRKGAKEREKKERTGMEEEEEIKRVGIGRSKGEEIRRAEAAAAMTPHKPIAGGTLLLSPYLFSFSLSQQGLSLLNINILLGGLLCKFFKKILGPWPMFFPPFSILLVNVSRWPMF